jgi:hypothetical protein
MATYEMLWDCSSCGTTKLLGKTHRRCPQCGAPQDPTKRYFPEPGQEVAVQGHVFVGVDWSCAACSTPNSNAAHFCVNCGNPKDGNVQVAKVLDTPRVARASSMISPVRSKRAPLVIAAVVLALLGACLVTVFWQRDVQVRVEQHAWSREIDIEQMSAVSESSWCDSMPSDAYSVSRSREVRSHNQIPDGQDCHTVRSDNGDGTFSTSNECTTRYRSEPVYDDKCHYTVNRWRVVDTVKAQGRGFAPPRAWPAVHGVGGGSCMGCRREGGRRESLVVDLRGTSGKDASKAWHCALDDNRWTRLRDGDVRTMRVRVVTGGAVCDTLRP